MEPTLNAQVNVSSNNNLRHYVTEESEILKLFPHDSYRKGQLACIKYIAEKFNSGKKFVIIEAPTGSGKSAIGITIAKMQEKSIYVTIQKILQEQLINSYANEGLRVLKGKANYPCTIYDLHGTELLNDKRINPQTLRGIQASTKKPNCAEGYCRTKLNQSTCNYCVKTKNADPNQPQTAIDTCEYYTAYQQAQSTKIAALNFDNLLHLIGNFNNRKLLILDETHNIESKILDFVSLTITDHKLQEFGISIPELEDASDYAIYFEENDIRSKINLIAEVFREEENMSKYDEYRGLAAKIDRFMSLLGQRWVCEYEQKQDRSQKYNSITLKPVFANKLANDILFKHFDHVLMMSATILDPTTFTSSLGIKKEDAASYKMANRFPKENRPIYIRNIAKMSGGKEQSKLWLPAMLKDKGAVDDILNQHSTVKGIIHTHNFTIAKYIMENSKHKRRLLFQNDFQNKELMLETHANSKNSVLVAPALHEGLDLYGDLSRFQIIVKVPWPNFVDDKQLNARITDGDDGPEYLRWLTALKLIQSYGRSIRSDSDWADTYILDSGISWFLKQASMIIPTWFTDAIKE